MIDASSPHEPDLDVRPIMARIREILAGREAESGAQDPSRPSTPAEPASPTVEAPEAGTADRPTLVGSLELVVQHIRGMQARISALEASRREDAGRIARLSEHLARLETAIMGAAERIDATAGQAAELARGLDQSRHDARFELGALEVRHREAERARSEEITRHLSRIGEELRGGLSSLREDQAAAAVRLDALEARHREAEAARAELDRARDEQLQQLRSEFAGLVPRLTDELDGMRLRLSRSERAARSHAGTGHGDGDDASPATAEGGEEGTSVGSPNRWEGTGKLFDYFLFEQKFRGTTADIRGRQKKYLDYFRGKRSVVDLGCGRGEFVELLTEEGVGVVGVDSNADMVDFCRQRNLNVVNKDIFEFLVETGAGALDGAFVSQVVEHLTHDQLCGLVSLLTEKLSPGGVAIFETINPHCVQGMGWFYLDPTHVRPVPSQLLTFALEQFGLDVRSVVFSSPIEGADVPEVQEVRSGLPSGAANYQDYAVIATKG